MKKTIILLAALCLSRNLFAICPSMDVTGDCKVNLADFATLAEQWMQEGVKPYSDLTLADILALDAEMTTSTINSSEGSEFMPGTYFIYKTKEDRFGKFMVENYNFEPADINRLTIKWVTYNYNRDGSIYSQGSLSIRQAYSCDLDYGFEAITENADWCWEPRGEKGLRLVPKNGARFKLMHRAIAPAGMAWVYVNEIFGLGFIGYMSKYETTNAQYCQFLNAALASGDITVSGSYVVGTDGTNGGEDFIRQKYYDIAGSGWTYNGATDGGAARINWTGSTFTVNSGFENHPVTYVSWYGATAFAGYYGWRLPKYREWQAVADWDGSYLYGCGTTINNSMANYENSAHPHGTTPVGSFGVYYGYGVADMAGNAREWTGNYGENLAFGGGCWYSTSDTCKISQVGFVFPDDMWMGNGFRVCR